MKATLRSAALVFLLAFASVRAETTLCTVITALPHAITAPGIYCLKASLASAGAGITIDADDVVLDLNGHAISGPANATGVASVDRSRITVKNGIVRGFNVGVALKSAGKSEGNVVEQLHVDTRFLGIEADGTGFVVRDNVLVGTGTAQANFPASGSRRDRIRSGFNAIGNNFVRSAVKFFRSSNGYRGTSGAVNTSPHCD